MEDKKHERLMLSYINPYKYSLQVLEQSSIIEDYQYCAVYVITPDSPVDGWQLMSSVTLGCCP